MGIAVEPRPFEALALCRHPFLESLHLALAVRQRTGGATCEHPIHELHSAAQEGVDLEAVGDGSGHELVRRGDDQHAMLLRPVFIEQRSGGG